MNVLSSSYKKKNSITEENVLANLPIVANGSVFSARKMYVEKIDENNYKYYIEGYLETGSLNLEDARRVKSYMIVYLDKEETIFSAEPYDGKEFEEGTFK